MPLIGLKFIIGSLIELIVKFRFLNIVGPSQIISSYSKTPYPKDFFPSSKVSKHAISGWLKSAFMFFHKIVWKNLNELFDQLNTQSISTSTSLNSIINGSTLLRRL